MFKNWSNRDWIWTIGILVMIIILLVADFFNFPNIEANFSIISSAVSIALALVAIFIALKQESDNQQVNNQVNHLLNEISASIRNVNDKVDKIQLDPGSSAELVDEFVEIKGKDNFTKDDLKEIVDEVSKTIELNINQQLEREKSMSKLSNFYSNKQAVIYSEKDIDASVREIILNNRDKSIQEIQKIIEKSTGKYYSNAILRNMMKKDKI
ncbi:hypothetical protein [Bacillus cereus]|uniref:hypothetical protein n=1 Tax=Bacillus cereus TaxID=1396 RepID=UPI000BF7E805|nr:hypothetical protein [Bacillus cereus]PER61749.1 hypothetical protein CN502_28530 [Bacillus cereus]PFD42741.1 hypothetical protein CN293_29630 [Bacillus cereus]PFJ15397.1 hypothetical protein COI91_29665 [Bacillus cereus]PGW02092.1 hypothetical protein COD97_32410 [Bacillus cereus]